MGWPSFVASRSMQSRRRGGFLSFITTIAVAGVALGVATLIITLAVLEGFEREITDKVIGFTSHVQVLGFQNQPLREAPRTVRFLRDSVREVSDVTAVASREGLIRAGETVDGVLVRGVDPMGDLGPIRRYLVAGEFDLARDPGDPPPLVIGGKLARRLAIGPGDRVTVFSIGEGVGRGEMPAMQFRVAGVYESGMAEYDDITTFTALSDAQALFGLGDAVTGYEIMLTDTDSLEEVADRIGTLLQYPHYARSMRQSYRNVFSWIELQKKPVPIILGGVTIVATVNIIGTLLMMVLEKVREIGVLRAMGATRGGIARIFLRKGLTIALAGTFLGNVVGFAACAAQEHWRFFALPSDIYFMSTVPILMLPWHFALVSAVSVALCLLCALLPARLASRLSPVDALRMG
jgi:lipoprotein-releasing system permease protein